jgi:primosomal protein N' (replication factor Y)
MRFYEVAPTRIIRAGTSTLTYASEEALTVGQVVLIEVGAKELPGLVIKEVAQPTYKTKPILSKVEEPLPVQLVTLALWIADYYATPLATVLQTLLPRGLTKKRRATKKDVKITQRDRTKIVFNAEQEHAIKTILTDQPGTFLFQGITGSGKTEVYKEVAKKTLEMGRSIIILTPEIGLTPQVVAEFAQEFDDIILTHSTMTEAERHLAWLEALNSEKPRVVIGPRSALFMPLKSVGAIIVDEAHEPSYKQEQSPRYSALRVATMLGRFHNAKVIFGSATPSVADRYVAEQTGKSLLTLTHRARPGSVEPTITLIDMKKRENFKHHRFISDELIQSIEKNLANKHQTLIFHNRRGSAATTLCDNCGWTAMCPNCFIPLTLHGDHYELRCHICGHHEKVPSACPVCQHAEIIHKGIGTKLIETDIRRLFTKATIARFDSDTKDADSMNNQYDKLYDGSIDIAIGTQIVAKGLDLPHLRTVGVVQADSGMALPDFAADERSFQLLSQVIGRVGRNHHATEVIVQTYQPTHPSIVDALSQDYESFYETTLATRKAGLFPPFVYLLQLTCIYKTEAGAVRAAQDLAKELRKVLAPDMQLLGPTPSFYERQRDSYRWQLIVKSKRREALIELLAHIPPAHWQFELDPSSLL